MRRERGMSNEHVLMGIISQELEPPSHFLPKNDVTPFPRERL